MERSDDAIEVHLLMCAICLSGIQQCVGLAQKPRFKKSVQS